MEIIDLTDVLDSWLDGEDPVRCFTGWVKELPPEIQLGFSGLGKPPGARPGDEEWDLIVRLATSKKAKVRDPLMELARGGSWREKVEETIARAETLLGGHADCVVVVVSIGLGARNASMGYRDGRGLAFLWLEHFLEPGLDSGYLDHGTEAIPVWLGHEIAHAVRYATPGTASLVPRAMEGKGPWDFWETLEGLPLAERFLDEGLATAFARDLVPDVDEAEILGMSVAEIQWLEENIAELVEDRRGRWDFTAWDPETELVRESLWYDPDRSVPPWTIERPPGRWGYYAGYRDIRGEAVTDWRETLTRATEGPGTRERGEP